MPNELSDIDKYNESFGFILGLKDFCWFMPLSVTIDELKTIVPMIKQKRKAIFISLNRLMYNKDIPLLKEYLLVIDKIGVDGILYDDIAIFNLSISLNIKTPLIWYGIHSFTNNYTSNYWYKKGIKYGVLSTEITLDHIKEISEKSNMSLMMYGYGYLPMFVSSRPLLSSYFKYINGEKNNITYHMYEGERRLSYPTYETDNGTIILSANIINTILELPILNNTVEYLILSSLNIPTEYFDKVYYYYVEALLHLDNIELLKTISEKVDKDSIVKTDKGFLYKETVYRVKNDGER
jgi:putative protease